MQKGRRDDHDINFSRARIQAPHGQLIPGTGVPVQPYETMQDPSLGAAMQYPQIGIAGAPASFQPANTAQAVAAPVPAQHLAGTQPPAPHHPPVAAVTAGGSAAPVSASAPVPSQSSTAAAATTQATHSQGHGQSGSTGTQHFQRLKVEDALSYLDQVKLQFSNQPQVYNDFLDIMKEFKSQSIDTPGVIKRVSSLFSGHPDLIVGFNTFLPPGYKIELRTLEDGQVLATATHVSQSASGNATTREVVATTRTQAQARKPAADSLGFTKIVEKPTVKSEPATYGQQPPAPVPPPQQPPVKEEVNQQQPVEFNHAISYVNKIKNRFHRQPDIYKAFLEILHTYQKEQRSMGDVFNQVATLFKNEKDLLNEFGQFLPDAGGASAGQLLTLTAGATASRSAGPAATTLAGTPSTKKSSESKSTARESKKNSSTRRVATSTISIAPPAKKPKREDKLEASPIGNYCDFAFFDKVRKALRNQEVYDNFLRCLELFNREVISRQELVQIVTPFLGKFPELFTWFKQFLGHKDSGPVEAAMAGKERMSTTQPDIDYSSCKRCGNSYLALPKSFVAPKCSGRTALCREVLNDTWVSLPLWSEDSAFLGTRKTMFEEYIFRAEDERFELDVVMETNLSTIRVLEAVQNKLNRLAAEEAGKLRLDNKLGGESESLHRKAIYRIYGDKAAEIIEGLKKMPSVAVPVVLKRLKSKDAEWRDALRTFNKHWREQNEKYYLKSLDHQGITFKTNDARYIRPKSLVNEIESIFDENQEKAADLGMPPTGPHMTFVYQDKSILDDAAALIIHHLKRQANIHKEDKTKIKQLLHCFLPDFFFAPRGELSDDEDGHETADGEPMEVDGGNGHSQSSGDGSDPEFARRKDTHIFYLNNHWYAFFRLHQLLCERLHKIYQRSVIIAATEAASKQESKESTAVQLHLKTPSEVDVEEYYPVFLDLVRSLLDVNMESNAFEDTCREMFGVHAYISFTMDKLVQNLVRQLQVIVGDEMCMQLSELFTAQVTATSSLSPELAEQSYRHHVEELLSDENCYRIALTRQDCKLTVELLETVDAVSEESGAFRDWVTYVSSLVRSEHPMSNAVQEELSKRQRFLLRNIRNMRRVYASQSPAETDGASTADEEASTLSYGSLECRVNERTFKLHFVSGTHETTVRPPHLRRGTAGWSDICERRSDNFRGWLSQRTSERCSDEDILQYQKLMLGKTDGVQDCQTEREELEDGRVRYTTTHLPSSS